MLLICYIFLFFVTVYCSSLTYDYHKYPFSLHSLPSPSVLIRKQKRETKKCLSLFALMFTEFIYPFLMSLN